MLRSDSMTPPRRVVITLDAVGGVWRYAIDLARGLDRRGIACRLIGFGPRPSETGALGLAKGELCWVDAPLDWMAESEAALVDGACALDRLAADWQADLMHLNLPSQAALSSSALPIVVAAHSCLPTWWAAVRSGPLPRAWEWQLAMNRRGLARAQQILVPSASHGAALAAAYGEVGSVRVVANATGGQPSTVTKRHFVFAAGRWWDDGKNGATLDAAAAISPWPVLMAGPLIGPNGTGIALSHAKPLGPLSAAKTLVLMRRAGIFVAPSRYEPFGLAVLEAAARGAALVLADIPSFRELWTGAAIFVPATDPAAYAGAIRRLAQSDKLRSQLARRARARAKTCDPRRQLEAILAAYAEALAAHSALIEAA